MAWGFHSAADFSFLVRWELFQVRVDKYHIMFFVNNEWGLLNVADRFSYRAVDGSINYTYEIYGNEKYLNVDRILRTQVCDVSVYSKDRLDIAFANGDVLSVYDNPSFRSWWFIGGHCPEDWQRGEIASDMEYEDLTEEEIKWRAE
jgi:hypothetical protein